MGIYNNIDSYRKMEVLLQRGPSLYPIEKNVHFICNEFLPWNTPKIFIPLLAKGKVENQNINIEDELTLKECYPTLYDKYEKACLEWQLISRQNFIARVTFKQLIERPTILFLHIAKTCAFQNRQKEIYPYQFPIYGSQITQAIQQMINKRIIWKEHEERLQEITYESIPDLIIEQQISLTPRLFLSHRWQQFGKIWCIRGSHSSSRHIDEN
ncbi:hypothetical protein TSAR_014399 [Trichomalopsis sarcophagae]|uniref:Uncharacterized protein n=1 Tax=Trichomalopsis sarcophagae TaxID=543379 RepID=A0A232EFJ6_9HYME|nr:hypothetical protein TSAR_014399 [Trichomalopsis sarcophagae]